MSRPSIRVEVVTGSYWWGRICTLIRLHHRHLGPPVGWRFGLVAWRGTRVVAVATVGQAVARGLNRAWEVTRVCRLPGAGGFAAASRLYGAASQEVVRRGGGRIVTYTLEVESGASLVHAGWRPVAKTSGGSWHCNSRPRNRQGLMPWEKQPQTGPKVRWEPIP